MNRQRASSVIRAALLGASLLVPGASAQMFPGLGGFFRNWNNPQWQMQQPTKLQIPGHGSVGFRGFRPRPSAYPQNATQLYGPQGAGLPMPQLVNTWDRYKAMVLPAAQGVQNFVSPIPGGQGFANSIQRNLIDPRYGKFRGNAIPRNLPGVAGLMQGRPGTQFYRQASDIAANAGLTLTPDYSPSRVAQGSVLQGQEMATENVMGSLRDLGTSAIGFGARYTPSIGNIPNYIEAGRTFLGGGGGAPEQPAPEADTMVP